MHTIVQPQSKIKWTSRSMSYSQNQTENGTSGNKAFRSKNLFYENNLKLRRDFFARPVSTKKLSWRTYQIAKRISNTCVHGHANRHIHIQSLLKISNPKRHRSSIGTGEEGDTVFVYLFAISRKCWETKSRSPGILYDIDIFLSQNPYDVVKLRRNPEPEDPAKPQDVWLTETVK